MHNHESLQHAGSCGPCNQDSNHFDIRQPTVLNISPYNLSLNYGNAWSHPIIGSDFEHVVIPQTASYDLWQPSFTSSNDFQLLLSDQTLSPVRSPGPLNLPHNALAAHRLQYQNSTATLPFDLGIFHPAIHLPFCNHIKKPLFP